MAKKYVEWKQMNMFFIFIIIHCGRLKLEVSSFFCRQYFFYYVVFKNINFFFWFWIYLIWEVFYWMACCNTYENLYYKVCCFSMNFLVLNLRNLLLFVRICCVIRLDILGIGTYYIRHMSQTTNFCNIDEWNTLH